MTRPPEPSLRRCTPHHRRALGLCLVAGGLVAALVPAAHVGASATALGAAPAAHGARVSAPASSEMAMAPPSPDLPGLPEISLDLVQVPVDSRAFRQARESYAAADAVLAEQQASRVGVDRSATMLRAARSRLQGALAAAEARAASVQSRLDLVEAAVTEAAVGLYTSGGTDARVNAALVSETPSISEHDRRDVLGTAALDVLLQEQTAYRASLAEVAERIDVTRAELDQVEADLGLLAEERPAAAGAEADAAPPVAAERVEYESARVLATVDDTDMALVALDAYYRAADTIAEEIPSCGVRWWGIAGVSRVEGRHGTYGGATLDPKGNPSRRIVGIQLNGTNETRVVADTDGGALDGDPAYDRAVGPMQFIPETWRRFASDGDGDGTADPFNLYDATLAAARYLCHGRGGLTSDAGLRAAYFSYNQSLAYVDNVLGHARQYERSVELPAPRIEPT